MVNFGKINYNSNYPLLTSVLVKDVDLCLQLPCARKMYLLCLLMIW
jgi:hypothetical protein